MHYLKTGIQLQRDIEQKYETSDALTQKEQFIRMREKLLILMTSGVTDGGQ